MSFVDIMFDGVPFGMIVGSIAFAGSPNNVKLSLCLAAFQKVETHVVGLGCFWYHCFLD